MSLFEPVQVRWPSSPEYTRRYAEGKAEHYRQAARATYQYRKNPAKCAICGVTFKRKRMARMHAELLGHDVK